MIRDFYEIFQKKTALIVNKVSLEGVCLDKFGEHTPRLLGKVPCSCDVARVRVEGLFAPENPNHEFNKKLKEIAKNIELMSCSTLCRPSYPKKNGIENTGSVVVVSH